MATAIDIVDMSLLHNKQTNLGASQRRYSYYRMSSYASTVLAVVILSVCPSYTCFVTKSNNALHIL